MAELDYALLAEFARVDAAGLLTIVGAGFSRIQPGSLPMQMPVFVAMRVASREAEEPPSFEVKLRAPDDKYVITLDGEVPRPPGAVAIEGEVVVQLAVGVTLLVSEPGIYRASIILGGDERRELRFLVEAPEAE